MCGGCGCTFELSARNTRVHRNAGTTPRCAACRAAQPNVVVTEKLRRWWLDRYTLDEIRVLAAELDSDSV